MAAAAAGAAAAATVAARADRSTATCLTSTAPAVTIAAAARPAAAFVASALAPACSARAAGGPGGRAAAAPRRRVPPPAAAVVPRWASSVFLSSSSGPTGKTAASALLFARSCLRKVVQRSHVRRWRRTGAVVRAQALGDLAELVAHLVAGQQARLGRLGERDAGAHEQRLHRRDRRLHRLGDLLVGERVDLAQQQRGALRLGQVLHVGDRAAGTPRACGPCRPS